MSATITPAHTAHEDLVADVSAWLLANSFWTISLAYHDMAIPKHIKGRLALMRHPGAIIVRHRPDRLSFHQHENVSFLWEAKTKGATWTGSYGINIDRALVATREPDRARGGDSRGHWRGRSVPGQHSPRPGVGAG